MSLYLVLKYLIQQLVKLSCKVSMQYSTFGNVLGIFKTNLGTVGQIYAFILAAGVKLQTSRKIERKWRSLKARHRINIGKC